VHLHPHRASQLASERRCDMLARAQQQCRARQATAMARAARPTRQAERRMGRAVRTARGLWDWSNDSATGHRAGERAALAAPRAGP
jgi:hypothetical protein